MQCRTVTFRHNTGGGSACRGDDDRSHRRQLLDIEAQTFTEQRDNAGECHERPAQFAGSDPLTRDVDMRQRDGEERKRREQDCGQAAVDELLTP